MSSTVVLLLGVVGLGGCNDRPTGPAATAQRLSAARAAGLPFTEGLASPEWQEIARNFVMQSTVSRNSAAAARVYAYLSVAQYDAVVRAEDDVGGNESEPEPAPVNGLGSGGRSRLETDRGAVAGASAAVTRQRFGAPLAPGCACRSRSESRPRVCDRPNRCTPG